MTARTIKNFKLFCIFLALAISHNVFTDVPVPELKTRVTDLTGTLSDLQSKTLEEKLAGFEKEKGSQISILIVPTTEPEAIEQFSIRVLEKWKLGRKKIDDGVLLLVAKNDRKLRIEVGYGLEGSLTDAKSKNIIENIIKPEFKRGDFYSGIGNGIGAIINVITGENLSLPKIPPVDIAPVKTDANYDSSRNYETNRYLIAVPLMMIAILMTIIMPIFASVLVSTFFVSLVFMISFTLMNWPMDFNSILQGYGISVAISFLVVAFIRWAANSPSSGSSSGGYSSSSSRSSYSSSSRSSSSSGSSSSGYSGGGGSFGGGGASGSW